MEAKVIVIVGPTCSGKTKLSLILAENLKTEIISADSRQVFRKLNIGTAKAEKIELEKIKHYFIDELEPDDEFNASKFSNEAEKIILSLIKEKKIPIVAGGSGLYIKALIDGISETADSSENIRTELLALRRAYGDEFLYNELKKVDSVSAESMLPQNWKRVIRALEVYRITGRQIWKHHQGQSKEKRFNFVQIGLLWDREILYKNIETRVDKMIESGLVDEVKIILKSGYSPNLNSLNTVGYKEIIDYLDNKISHERAIELIKRNSRRFAKRQMTWFNADKRIHWYKINSDKDLHLLADKILKGLNEKQN